MNNAASQGIFYDDTTRSPGSQRQSAQPRQVSGPFDTYARGNMGGGTYFADDTAASSFELGRGGLERLNTSVAGTGGYNLYDPVASQTWNPNAFANNGFGTGALGNASRTARPMVRGGRGNIPSVSGGLSPGDAQWKADIMSQGWLEQPMITNSISAFGNMAPPGHSMRPDAFQTDLDEELIPTAIVIKNIPFAVRKEELVEVMTGLNLPLPYAFNYHFDNGVFRGLAFANFTSAEETAMVIETLNHYELNGRKLRVEYKKMLPLQERERIEREKRERRGQLEEQHRPMAAPSLNQPPSLSSLASSRIAATSPSPVESRNIKLDLNDQQTLGFYNEMLLFKNDRSRESVVFPTSLNPIQRRTIHTIAHMLGLSHLSRGEGQQRQVFVSKSPLNMADNNVSPPMGQANLLQPETQRRTLNRAATTDFSEARGQDLNIFGTLRGQHSAGGLLALPDSPGGGLGNNANLRAAKSFADLRSYTPSPVPSTASFPNFPNITRMGDGSVNTPTLTPTASHNPLGGQGPQPQRSGDDILINSLGSMSIGGGPLNPAGSPRRGGMRSVFPWDRDQGVGQGNPSPAPIGSNRAFSLNAFSDELPRGSLGSQTLPIRQPRGPAPERAPGFAPRRQNGQGMGHQQRGSDELSQRSQQQGSGQSGSSNVEIIVEH